LKESNISIYADEIEATSIYHHNQVYL